MNKTKVWIAAALALCLAGIGFTSSAFARPWAKKAAQSRFEDRPLLWCFLRNLGKLAELRKDIDLTEGQKEKFRELAESRRPEVIATLKSLRDGRRKVMSAVRADKPDEAAIRAAVKGMTDRLADAAVQRARIRQEAMGVLTAKQRGKVDRFIADVQESVDEAIEELQSK